MTWMTVAAVGGSLLGGVLSSNSASEAAQTQAAAARAASQASLQASRESNQLTADIYKQNLRNQNPNLQAGQTSLAALQSAMGLGQLRSGNTGMMTGMGGPADNVGNGTYTNASGQTVDASGNVVASPSGIGSIMSGATQEELNAAGSPYAGALTETFKPSDITTDPSYQWRLDQGMSALRAQQAAGGNRFSGQALKDITNYGQGAASQEYGNAYNRFMQNKEALYNRLSGMAGLSSSTANSMGTAGANAASQINQNTLAGSAASTGYLTGGAAAQAAGQIGSTNALVGGINQGTNNYMMMDYLRNKGGMATGQGTLSGPSNAALEQMYYPQ